MKKSKETARAKFASRHCHGKRRITSHRQAKRIAKLMSAKNHTPFDAYSCKLCGYYHVGHSRKTPFLAWILAPHHQGQEARR